MFRNLLQSTAFAGWLIFASLVWAQPTPDNLTFPVSHTGTGVCISQRVGTLNPESLYVFDALNQPCRFGVPEDPNQTWPHWEYVSFGIGSAHGSPHYMIYDGGFWDESHLMGYPVFCAAPTDIRGGAHRHFGDQIMTLSTASRGYQRSVNSFPEYPEIENWNRAGVYGSQGNYFEGASCLSQSTQVHSLAGLKNSPDLYRFNGKNSELCSSDARIRM